ncbi:uncharacterized protein LOC118414898 [Branchiostoma floridae]|uniref:Uncharacterized protein LOC118414898 n=1 Tax=Branchiostoma floridae TaxID=7739 RepID=A0A9J7L311_BRAFL|nr:uncharacterized protein LOC118414898 [Branchiostoma floridae]
MSGSSPRGQELSPSPHTPGQERKVPPNLTIYPASRTTDLPPCLFCKRCENHQEKYGQLITDKDSGITVHYFCLLLSSGIRQEGGEEEGIYGFREQEVIKEYRRGLRLKCNFCEQKGATIGCCTKKCRMMFHLPCGMENGTLHLFFDDFKSYCKEHRPMQKISKDMILDTPEKNPVCPICMYHLKPKPSHNVIKTPCCKRTWLHRDCVQRQASSAGMYFFRCPICNSKETFQQEMLKNGIYIPEQDAAWELEDNAFEELLQRYNRCDAEKCECVQGRNFNKEWGKWRIVLCEVCGSSGIHKLCGQLKKAKWKCKDCTDILAKAKEAAKERKRKEREEQKKQAKLANDKKENKDKAKLKVRKSSKKGRKLILSGRPMSDERRILGRNCRVVLTPVNALYTENQCQLGATLSQPSSDEEISFSIEHKDHIPGHKPINVRMEGVEGSMSSGQLSGSASVQTSPKGRISTSGEKMKGVRKKSLKRRKVSCPWTAKERQQKKSKELAKKRKSINTLPKTETDSLPSPQSPEIDIYKSRNRATPTSSVKLGLYLSPSSDDDDSIPLARLVLREKLAERSPFACGQSIPEDYQNEHNETSKPGMACAVGDREEATGFIDDEEELQKLSTETYKGSPGPSQIHTPKRSPRLSEEPNTPCPSVHAPELKSMLLRSGSSIKSHSGEKPSKDAEDMDMSDLSPLVGRNKRKGNASEEALVPNVRKQTARKSCQPYRPPCRRNLLEYSGHTERQPSPDTPEESSSAKVNPPTASGGTEGPCDSPSGDSTATDVIQSKSLQPDLLDIPECLNIEKDPCQPSHQVDCNISRDTEMPNINPHVVVTAVCNSPNSSQSSDTASTSESSSCLACLIAARRRTMGPVFIDLTENASSVASQQDLTRPSSPSTITLSSSGETDSELEVEFVAETPQAKNTNSTCLPGIPTRSRFGSDNSDITAEGPAKNNNFVKNQGERGRERLKSNDGPSNVSKTGAKSKSVGLKVKRRSGGKDQRSKSMGDMGRVRHKSGNKTTSGDKTKSLKVSRKGRVRKLKQLRIKWPDPFSLQFRSTETCFESEDGDVQGVTMHVQVKASPKCLSEGQGGQKRKRSSSLTGGEVDVPSISVKVTTTTPSRKRWSSPVRCETETDRAAEDEGAVVGSGLRMTTRQTPLKPAGSTVRNQDSTSPRTPSRLSKRNRVLED